MLRDPPGTKRADREIGREMVRDQQDSRRVRLAGLPQLTSGPISGGAEDQIGLRSGER